MKDAVEAAGVVVVRRALISVSDKRGVADLARALASVGVELLSTGGTAAAIRDAGVAVRDVSAVTGAAEMLDGRVKTLHPSVHAGLLARRDRPDHMAALEAAGLAPIDLVVANLYPFEETVAAGADAETAIETIDIGGPAMIRAAAKNHAAVAILTDPVDYATLIDGVGAMGAATTTAAERRAWAAKAFARTAAYDAAISAWFAEESGDAYPARLAFVGERVETLRYGENPHQTAAVYRSGPPRPGVVTAARLQGKELSYNNLGDAEAAFELAADLARFDRPAVVIVKHANPCGAALGATVADAFARARAGDPESAFGGVCATNRAIDADAAAAMLDLFLEVAIAPEVTAEARALLAQKTALRVLETGGLPDARTNAERLVRGLSGGLLLQSRDVRRLDPSDLTVVTRRAPSPREIDDLLFAWTVVKHVKSNAIVFARDGATVGVGAGQMSRVDATKLGARKAEEIAAAAGAGGRGAHGSVVASDAFFPFADGLEAAAAAGATAIIQPGGSMRDQEVIAAADAAGVSMVFTGVRHFRH